MLFIFVAFLEQQKQLKLQQKELALTREEFNQQNNTSKLQRFENTFFNLVSIQNQILKDIVHDNGVKTRLNNYVEKEEYKGREFFNFIKEQIESDYLIIKKAITGEEFLDETRHIKIPVDSVLGKYEMTRQELIDEYTENDGSFDELSLSLKCDKIIFEKYQYKYAHYFRHLYRILKLIYETEKLEKIGVEDVVKIQEIELRFRNYSKFLQAQMSTSELFIMFYNSLKFEKMKELVNKYDFLENLQKELLMDISHTKFYDFKFKSKSNYFKNK